MVYVTGALANESPNREWHMQRQLRSILLDRAEFERYF